MIFNNVYNLNWNSIGVELLPRVLRQPKWAAWLLAVFKPNSNLHTQFINYRRKSNYKIDHTPQVFSMENVLNDAFDQGQRRIYITDGVYLSALYFYNPEENNPVHFYNPEEPEQHPRFYDPQELEQLDVDFVVVLPLEFENVYTEDSPQMLRLRSLVDTYRLPDKTYQIQFN